MIIFICKGLLNKAFSVDKVDSMNAVFALVNPNDLTVVSGLFVDRMNFYHPALKATNAGFVALPFVIVTLHFPGKRIKICEIGADNRA